MDSYSTSPDARYVIDFGTPRRVLRRTSFFAALTTFWVLFFSTSIVKDICRDSLPGDNILCNFRLTTRTQEEDDLAAGRHLSGADAGSITCRQPVCLDDALGARLAQEEVHHLSNILDLVDGFGRPLGQIFDYRREYWSYLDLYTGFGIVPGMPHERIKMSLYKLISQAGFVHMEGRVRLAGLNILEKFRSDYKAIARELISTFQTLDGIRTIRNTDEGVRAKQFQHRRYIQEADSFVSETIRNLTSHIFRELDDALPLFHQASEKAEIARNTSALLLSDLNSELVNVPQILRSLPWWDRYSLNIFRRSKTAYFTKYLQFLQDNDSNIRFYAEGVQIIADNLLMLIDYVAWYRRHQSNPIDAHHLPQQMSAEDELQKLDRAIREFRLQARTYYEYAQIRDFSGPSAPPHRLGSPGGVVNTISPS